jgi:hypothetical protein
MSIARSRRVMPICQRQPRLASAHHSVQTRFLNIEECREHRTAKRTAFNLLVQGNQRDIIVSTVRLPSHLSLLCSVCLSSCHGCESLSVE